MAEDDVYRLPHHIHVSSVLPEVHIPLPSIPESHLLPNAVALRRNGWFYCTGRKPQKCCGLGSAWIFWDLLPLAFPYFI